MRVIQLRISFVYVKHTENSKVTYIYIPITQENIFIMKDIIAYEAAVNDLAERKILIMQERGQNCGKNVTQ